MVIIRHSCDIFESVDRPQLSRSITRDGLDWLMRHIGPIPYGINDTSRHHPWRHRVWDLGPDSKHVFFFYEKRDAMLFKLVWA